MPGTLPGIKRIAQGHLTIIYRLLRTIQRFKLGAKRCGASLKILKLCPLSGPNSNIGI